MCPSLLDPLLYCPLPDSGFSCTSLHLPHSRDTEDGNEVVSPLQPPFPTLPHKQEEERTPLHLRTGRNAQPSTQATVGLDPGPPHPSYPHSHPTED